MALQETFQMYKINNAKTAFLLLKVLSQSNQELIGVL